MIVKKTYIADDGAEFQNEWECAEYEAKILSNKFKDTALLFDIDGKSLSLTERGFRSAYFIWCKTDEAAQYLLNEFGAWENPWCSGNDLRAGFWYYDVDCWRDIDGLIQIIDLVKSIMEGVRASALP